MSFNVFSLFPFALCIVLWGMGVQAQADSSPGMIPLAVKSPYLHTWAQGSMAQWPKFWNIENEIGWEAMIRVDNQTFQWLGSAPDIGRANLTTSTITPTRTILSYDVGNVTMNVTFLSPLEPSDLSSQSIPFSYMAVDVQSKDGASHDVQLYSDISGQWISGGSEVVNWSTQSTQSTTFHQLTRTSSAPYSESKDMLQDGTVYYGLPQETKGMSWQTGPDVDVRGAFKKDGVLANTQDTAFRALNDRWPVLGFAVNLGNIVNSTSSTVWSLGVVRDPAVKFKTASGQGQSRSLCFWAQFSKIEDVLDFVISRFSSVHSQSQTFDSTVLDAARATSDEYANLISLATRQTLASLETTILNNGDGTYNVSDVKMFMRDVGSSQRVNPLDTLASAFPMLMHLNSTYGGYLLRPMLEAQVNSSSKFEFAAPDIGTQYPVAQGDNISGNERFGVDESASMLLLSYAYALKSGDGSLLKEYYDAFHTWADFLVKNALSLPNQIPFVTSTTTTSTVSSSIQAHLSLKAILGIKAMARVSEAASQKKDADHFNDAATSLLSQWSSSDGVSKMFNPGGGSWEALWWDKWLELGVVDSKTYDQHAYWIRANVGKDASSLQGSVLSRTDWTMLTSAVLGDNELRKNVISKVRSAAWDSKSTNPFSTVFSGETQDTGAASPGVGAVYALLSSGMENRQFSVAVIRAQNVNVGVIVGAVLGGVAFLGFLVLGAILYWRRRQRVANLSPIEPRYRASFMTAAFSSSSSSSGTMLATPGVLPYTKEFLPPNIQANQGFINALPSLSSLLRSSPEKRRMERQQENETSMRAEIERMRRDMEWIRQGQVAMGIGMRREDGPDEPPPSYAPENGWRV